MTTRGFPSRLVLIGSDVSNSLSPIFQRAALHAAGISVSYDLMDVAPGDLERAVEEIRRDGVGGNVTRPHKVAFHNVCDVLTPLARRVGAVNTFWIQNGRLHGDNTDVEGFDHAARELMDVNVLSANVLVLGAGGAAAAVLAAVERWPGGRATVVSRSRERSAALAARFASMANAGVDAVGEAERAALIVNATPVGQRDDQHPLALDAVPRDAAAIDLVYRRGETAWVRALRARGNVARDGMAMLLEQGALSFTKWFGREPDREAMRRAIA